MVYTNAVVSDHWLYKLFSPIIVPLYYLFLTPERDCAEYMLFALLETKKGPSLRTRKGDSTPLTLFPGKIEDAQRRVWEHSMTVTKSESL